MEVYIDFQHCIEQKKRFGLCFLRTDTDSTGARDKALYLTLHAIVTRSRTNADTTSESKRISGDCTASDQPGRERSDLFPSIMKLDHVHGTEARQE